jgi:hypothetical protein
MIDRTVRVGWCRGLTQTLSALVPPSRPSPILPIWSSRNSCILVPYSTGENLGRTKMNARNDNGPRMIRLTFSPEFPSRTVKVRCETRLAEATRHQIFGTQPYFTGFGVVGFALLVIDIFQTGWWMVCLSQPFAQVLRGSRCS